MAQSNKADDLSRILTEALENLTRSEEKNTKKLGNGDLTSPEVRLMECVSQNSGNCTVSLLASSLGVTLPTITVSVNKLEKKGYIKKSKNVSDGRSVLISLTEKGIRATRLNEYFHEQMIFKVMGEFSSDEIENLCRSLRKLNSYIDNNDEKKSAQK